jgi:hypothetical protein
MLSIIEFEQEIEGGEHELAETRGNFTRILGPDLIFALLDSRLAAC